MPRQPQGEKIKCHHFLWLVGQRRGVYQADGRSNQHNVGRYSLGSTDRVEALKALDQLDLVKAIEHGLASPSLLQQQIAKRIALLEGKDLYLAYVNRPQVRGGVRPSSKKRYRAVFDKFVPFAEQKGCKSWQEVNKRVLDSYAAFLKEQGYKNATQYLELTTILQAINWMIEEGLVSKECKFKFKMRKPKGTTTHCWTVQDVEDIQNYCRSFPKLIWLADVLLALAVTGMRISELVNLRWPDIKDGMITLINESDEDCKDGQVARTTKTGHDRSFPINQKLLPVLQRLPHRRDGLVIHGPLGGKLKADLVRRTLEKKVLIPLAKTFPPTRDTKGFLRGRLHSFRHFFCSACANENVPQQVVMRWLGHRDSKMTNHYYQLKDEESRRQMNRLTLFQDQAGDGAVAS